MGKGGFRYEYRIPKEETPYVETVMRMYFHKFAYGAGPNGEPVIRTNADADEFRKIRGRDIRLKTEINKGRRFGSALRRDQRHRESKFSARRVKRQADLPLRGFAGVNGGFAPA